MVPKLICSHDTPREAHARWVPSITNNEVSSRAGREWHGVDQAPWNQMAEADAKKHREMFPNCQKANPKIANSQPADVAARVRPLFRDKIPR
ncbi:hypothetical protein GGR57DRAFT_505967 [Xylariaceae sp. FL1272]|nr:hypothetical protein GGR57DRAFT_505967 [Xylariaceae sp. FL1272]